MILQIILNPPADAKTGTRNKGNRHTYRLNIMLIYQLSNRSYDQISNIFHSRLVLYNDNITCIIEADNSKYQMKGVHFSYVVF